MTRPDSVFRGKRETMERYALQKNIAIILLCYLGREPSYLPIQGIYASPIIRCTDYGSCMRVKPHRGINLFPVHQPIST